MPGTDVVQEMQPIADPDDEALRLAEEAAAAEGPAAALDPVATPADGAAPAAGAVVAPAAPAGQPAPGAAPAVAPQQKMVPVAAVIEARRKARVAEDEVIYRKGENEALRNLIRTQAAAPPAAITAPVQTPDDLIKAERAKVSAAAKQFDEGTITAVQYEQTRGAADDIIRGIDRKATLAATLAAMPKPQAAAPVSQEPSLADEAILEQQVHAIQAANPWTSDASPITDPEYDALTSLAYTHLKLEGVAVPATNRGTAILREKVAELASLYGPVWHPGWQAPAQAAAVPAAATPPLTTRQQQTQAKIDLAAAMPPDTVGMGQQPPSGAQMTEADVMALPQATLAEMIDKKDPRIRHLQLT